LRAEVVDGSGTVSDPHQFGAPQRDGADVYDEANLFVAAGASGSAWVQAVTYGAIDGAANAGGADVFLTSVPFDAAGPGEPGTGGPGGPGTGGSGAGAGAGAGGGAGTSASGGASGALGATGLEVARWLALALLVLGAGASSLVVRRRLHAHP
jgi:hypothetical protein